MEYSWSTIFENDQVNRVLNDYGGKDFWARVARFVVDDAGSSGQKGFNDNADGRVIQRFRPNFSHSDFFYSLNYEHVWIPFLKGVDPSKLKEAPKRPINWAFRISLGAVVVLALALLWMAATHHWKLVSLIHDKPAGPEMIVTPLIQTSGIVRDSAISPNDDDVAYVSGGNNELQSLYVQRIGSGPLQLTTEDEGNIESPAWSNDGKYIYYVRSVKNTQEIWKVLSLGGPGKRKIGSRPLFPETHGQHAGLAVSPDDKYIAIPSGGSDDAPGIFLISTSGSDEPRRVTTAEFGDYQPSFSPDGKQLAFVRSTSVGVEDLYIVTLATPQAMRKLTADGKLIDGLAWTRDSSEIVFASNRGGIFGLWRIDQSGGTPRNLGITGTILAGPSISRRSNRLTVTYGSSTTGIWHLSVFDTYKPLGSPEKMAYSTADGAPEYSPDGSKIVFVSSQTGNPEIWTCDRNGSNRIQLTNSKGSETGTPRWSPDGQQIAYDSRTTGHARIYIMQADGSDARQITNGPGEDAVPSWSNDGAWVFFASTRSRKNEIWKVSAFGGTPSQITHGGGFVPLQSRNGNFIYYAKDSKVAGIWRVPVKGGNEISVTDDLAVGLWGQWTLSKDGIYFIQKTKTQYGLRFLAFDAKTPTELIALPYLPVTWTGGLSVSRDTREILFTLVESQSSIKQVENFR